VAAGTSATVAPAAARADGRRAGNAAELRHPPTDVVTLGVEPLGLPKGIEAAVRLGVGARAGHPLPVAGVVGHVGVEQVVGVPALAVTPVEPERLGEERGRDQAGPVVHEALRGELAHAGVDHGDAGPAGLPGREREGVAPPLFDRAATVRRPAQVGEAGQDLVEEVAPAQLPDVLLRSGDGHHGHRRHKAEVQVRAESGRTVDGQRVVPLDVVRCRRPPGPQPTQRGRLAARHEPGRPDGRRGQLLGADIGGDDRPRRPEFAPMWKAPPGAPVRGEDAIVVTAAARAQCARRHDRDRVGHAQVQAVRGAGGGETSLAAPRVRTGVGRDGDAGRADLTRHPYRLRHRIAVPPAGPG
jgi:hypothetical protein